MEAMGMGGKETVEESPVADESPEPVVTDEAREATAEEVEVDRKKAIRKHLGANLSKKTDTVKFVRDGKRNPRAQPDFEDHAEDNAEAATEE
jgi:hypothetical protein